MDPMENSMEDKEEQAILEEMILEDEKKALSKPKDGSYPMKPLYCGVCTLPPEYCCHLVPKSRFEACWSWLSVNAPNVYPDLAKWMSMKKKQGQKRKKEEEEGKKMFFRWCEIPSFSSIKSILSKSRDLPNKIKYRGKIKLHGTNASVMITKDLKVYAQRRNGFIPNDDEISKQDTPSSSSSSPFPSSSSSSNESSNFDFSPFVYRHSHYWKSIISKINCQNIVIFGEWCGRGIMKGAAICSIPSRHFAIFCIVINRSIAITDPKVISSIMGIEFEDDEQQQQQQQQQNDEGGSKDGISNPHGEIKMEDDSSSNSINFNSPSSNRPPKEIIILPWIPHSFEFDFSWLPLHNDDPIKAKGKAQTQIEVDRLNALVSEVDQSDPFVLKKFGIQGIGEGIVFYPVHAEHHYNQFIKTQAEDVEVGDGGIKSSEYSHSPSSSNSSNSSNSANSISQSSSTPQKPLLSPFNLSPHDDPSSTQLYPLYDTLSRLMFKAKGKSHRVTMAKEAASIDPEIASSIQHLLSLFVTHQRCEQGMVESCPHLYEHISSAESSTSKSSFSYLTSDMIKFSGWMVKDVRKESTNEIGSLSPKLVDNAVKLAAEKWFISQMESVGIYQAPE